MARFLTSLILEDTEGVRMVLHQPLEYESDIDWCGEAIDVDVPAGFITDFASIPRFFHRIVPKNGLYDPAAVVHDWLYSTQPYPKEICDRIFHEAMLIRGVGRTRAWLMYRAVKAFGGIAWNNHAKEIERRKELNESVI